MSYKLEGDLQANLIKEPARQKAAIVAAANYMAPQCVKYMRQNAPWTDRTGAARNGLNAKVDVSADKVAIICYHSVPYGIFLEVRWGGKYAIIRPTIQAMGPEFVDTIGKMMFK